MENNPNQDINYQPQAETSGFKKPFLKTQQRISNLFRLTLGLIILFFLLIITILILNYFNIFSISQKYPDYFFRIPHQSFKNQDLVNNKILLKPSFSSNTNSWTMLASFYVINKDIVYFKYKDQLVYLKKNTETLCSKAVPNENSSIIEIKAVDCSEILINTNKSKSMVINYATDKNGEFALVSIELD